MQSVRKFRITSVPQPSALAIAYTKNVPLSNVENMRFALNKAIAFWSQFGVLPKPMDVSIFTELDHDWYIQRWNDLGKDNTGQAMWDRIIGISAGAVGSNAEGQRNMWLKIGPNVPPEADLTKSDVNLSYQFHETTHFFQNTFVANLASMSSAPCWFAEGSANFVGSANAYDDPLSTFRDANAFRQSKIDELVKYLAPEVPNTGNILHLLNDFPFTSPQCQFQSPELGYGLGMLVSEKLICDFGILSFIDFMKALGETDWKSAFGGNYGISADNWYKDSLVPYLVTILSK